MHLLILDATGAKVSKLWPMSQVWSAACLVKFFLKTATFISLFIYILSMDAFVLYGQSKIWTLWPESLWPFAGKKLCTSMLEESGLGLRVSVMGTE